jgi:geranylgeranyl diphosphate synthase type II
MGPPPVRKDAQVPPSVDTFSLSRYWDSRARRVHETLDQLLAPRTPDTLWESMRYSALAGGKRLRPLLAIAACEALGGSEADALPAACALELIHTQSLVHDDLPCMDDDSLRRGKPTNHVVFGEALALLAGDGLVALAFQILVEEATGRLPPAVIAASVRELARATFDMVAGQVVDVQSEGQAVSPATLEFIHRHKTGALLRAAVRMGAMAAGADPERLERLTRYGEALGLAFQIVDDLLDMTASPEELGKTPGKDVAAGKATYPALYGLEAARAEAERQVVIALGEVAPLGEAAVPLRALARFVSERKH